jgi:hypothetical protein
MLRRLQHLSSFFQDVWDFYFMGWLRLALTVHGNGETTTARYGQFKDNQYYLYLLDTLDYHLRWGNYSAKNRSTPNHQGTASLSFQAGK